MAIPKPRPLTRLLQVTIPREAYILLGQLMQRRVENDFAPSKATKSAVMTEAITRMAVAEGLIDPPQPEKVKEITTKPFEVVPIGGHGSSTAATGTDHA